MNRNLVTATITICAVCLLIAASLSFSGFFEQISHDIYNPEKNEANISTNPAKVSESEVFFFNRETKQKKLRKLSRFPTGNG